MSYVQQVKGDAQCDLAK